MNVSVFQMAGVGPIVGREIRSTKDEIEISYPSFMQFQQSGPGQLSVTFTDYFPVGILEEKTQRKIEKSWVFSRSLVLFQGKLKTDLVKIYDDFVSKVKQRSSGILIPTSPQETNKIIEMSKKTR